MQTATLNISCMRKIKDIGKEKKDERKIHNTTMVPSEKKIFYSAKARSFSI